MIKRLTPVRQAKCRRRTIDVNVAQCSHLQFPPTTYRFYIFITLLYIVLFSFINTVQADVFENFDSSGSIPATFTMDGSAQFRTSNAYSSPNAIRIRETSSLTYVGEDGYGKDGGIGTLSFWYRRSGLANTTFYIEYSTDGGTSYTEIAAPVADSQTYSEWSQAVNFAGNNILIRFRTEYSSVMYGVYVDDISITDNSVFDWTANASFDPVEYNFGLVVGDTFLDKVITINNAGAPTTESLVIDATGMTFTGTGASKFSVVGFLGATVIPGGSTTMTLRYRPGNSGAEFTAFGTLLCNDPVPPSINLSGSNCAEVADLNVARNYSMGSLVRVIGTVTATVATNGLTTNRNRFFIQDTSGVDGQTGLMIDDPDFYLGQTYPLGEQLQNLTGILSTVDGIKALVPTEPATDMGVGTVPAPLELNGSETFASIESELVVLSDVYFEESGMWTADQIIDIVSPLTGPLNQIYVAVGSGLVGELIPAIALPKHIVGIAGLSGSIGQLLPRLAADVTVGVAENGAISLNDNSTIDFGNCDINTGWTIGRRLEIYNSGVGPLTWTGAGISFNGTDASEFGAHPSIEVLPVIWPGTTETLVVYMDADSIGTKTAQMTLLTNAVNDPEITINLTGVGVDSEDITIGWEQYSGGPEHRGRRYFNGTVTNLEYPVWQTGSQGLMASAAPCVIEDESSTIPVRIYCWGADGTGYSATYAFVKCFNGETGARVWTSDPINDIGYSIGFDSWHSMAADKRSNRVFLGMGDNVYCFDADSGVMCWESDPLRVDEGGTAIVCNSTCVVGKDYVYQTTYTGFGGTNYVQAFNISSGSEEWYYSDGGQGQETLVYHEVGEEAYIYRTNVDGYYPTGGGGITCLNANTGLLVWDNSAPLDGDPWWTEQSNFGGISFCDGEIYSPTYNFGGISELICVDASTGRLKWRATDSVASDAVPVVIADRVYITGHYDWNTGPSYVIGYDRTTGNKVYEVAVSEGNNMWNTSIAATNDMIYVTEGSTIYGMAANGLHILDPFTGEELVEQGALAERVRGSVAIGADGSIYALMDTEPNSGLAHLICYRAPVAGVMTIQDLDAPFTDGYTSNQQITLLHDAEWADEMRIWEEGCVPGSSIAYAANSSFTLSAGDGLKTIWAQYQNGSGDSEPVLATVWVGLPTANQADFEVRDFDGDMPAGQSDERLVVIEVCAFGAEEMMIWEDGTTGSWQSYSESSTLELSSGNGLKTVYACFRNPSGETLETLSSQIELNELTMIKDWFNY